MPMTAALLPPPARPVAAVVPRRKRFTTAEFYSLSQSGLLADVPMMLLDGEIVEMPIPNPAHVMSVTLVGEQLQRVFPTGHVIRVQQPLPLDLWSDPIPDVSIVRGTARDFARHPRSALLVVEVSDSSLSIDLTEKARLYAAGGIADYWVVDINGRQVHLFRDPLKDTVTGEARYATTTVIDAAGSVTPLAAPGMSIAVADFLP